jgi:ketosteroid isomerase-like protein
MEKEGIHQLMSGIVASLHLELITVDLKPKAVRIFGDFGIVHYEVHIKAFLKAGSELVVHERLTHTWLKTENGWKIICGMSAPLSNL